MCVLETLDKTQINILSEKFNLSPTLINRIIKTEIKKNKNIK